MSQVVLYRKSGVPQALSDENNRKLWETTLSVRPTQSARVMPDEAVADEHFPKPPVAFADGGNNDSSDVDPSHAATKQEIEQDDEELDPELHGLRYS